MQASSASGLEQSAEQQQLLYTETEAIWQHTQGRTEISPMPPLQSARYHPLGNGHGHARSVLRPECGAETQQPNRHRTRDLQLIRDDSKSAQKLAESGIWRHRHSYANSDTHSMHYTSPAGHHTPKHMKSLQSAAEGKTALEASSSWSAQIQPFGNGHGHTNTTPGPAQPSKRSSQISATQERQRQTLHQERETANLGPQSLPHVGPLVEGCGQLAEFLAQTPWEENRTGLGVTQIDVEQHLKSHNHICHQVIQMLEELPTEAIPTTEATKLQRLHSTMQLSCMCEWPKEFLQPETSTPE